ncbi:hypothetical protein LDBPK_041180 [Leishmania donovani]|uniref:Uncharacterized protein n=1 Tax=Leishmania donovani TaxID=5661 RepID=E9B883_LEIDO|nr:hypothetical protein LDBPK_041180 [Leishmania donovani]CBZ31456.1 hypothetical protein LDBPK_041180 [Leishmania donovani]
MTLAQSQRRRRCASSVIPAGARKSEGTCARRRRRVWPFNSWRPRRRCGRALAERACERCLDLPASYVPHARTLAPLPPPSHKHRHTHICAPQRLQLPTPQRGSTTLIYTPPPPHIVARAVLPQRYGAHAAN